MRRGEKEGGKGGGPIRCRRKEALGRYGGEMEEGRYIAKKLRESERLKELTRGGVSPGGGLINSL